MQRGISATVNVCFHLEILQLVINDRAKINAVNVDVCK